MEFDGIIVGSCGMEELNDGDSDSTKVGLDDCSIVGSAEVDFVGDIDGDSELISIGLDDSSIVGVKLLI